MSYTRHFVFFLLAASVGAAHATEPQQPHVASKGEKNQRPAPPPSAILLPSTAQSQGAFKGWNQGFYGGVQGGGALSKSNSSPAGFGAPTPQSGPSGRP